MRNALLSLSVRWVACFATILTFAQSRDFGGDEFARLSPAQAEKTLVDFRDSRLAGDLCLRIEITHKPRQGESSAPIKGTLWAGFHFNQGRQEQCRLDLARRPKCHAIK